MRIAKIELLQGDGGLRRLSFLKITTDRGLTGWAEFADGSPGLGGLAAVITTIGSQLLGKDPRGCGRIVSDLHALARIAHGGLHVQAIATLENACLEIKAKALGVPVYELFGGLLRESIPVYWSQCGMYRITRAELCEQQGMRPVRTLEDVEALGAEVRQRGFAALKTKLLLFGAGSSPRVHMPGFASLGMGPALNMTLPLAARIDTLLGAFRRGAGPDIELIVDANFNFRAEGFTHLARTLEAHHLRWLELDLLDPQALATLRRSTRTAIGSLESVLGRRRFAEFLQAQAVDVGIIDVMWNGFSESFAMASVADAFDTSIALHNYTGPLATVMSAHLAAVIPNLTIMELEVDGAVWGDRLLKSAPAMSRGHFPVPTGPGWGCELDETALTLQSVLQ
jgi:L-alanine-DL-glutamate epimerase-like enolase superfamily enzyme